MFGGRKLTLKQKYEADKWDYLQSYLRWLDIVEDRLGDAEYETVEDAIRDLYRTRTMKDLELLFGKSAMSICNLMRRLGIPARDPAHKLPEEYFGYGKSPLIGH